MKIGIFDSGIGGLSVLYEALNLLPDENYIFYADTDHVPYGEKSSDEILGFSDEITDFMIKRGADAVLIACNTASACAAAYLREKYSIPIIAMEPAVRPALHISESPGCSDALGCSFDSENSPEPENAKEPGRVLVAATPVTLREEKLKNLIRRENGEDRVILAPLPGLVRFAENEEFESSAVTEYLKSELSDYIDMRLDAFVLGCTHFNYFRLQICSVIGENIPVIDGNKGTVRQLAKRLGITCKDTDDAKRPREPDTLLTNKTLFYTSGKPMTEDEVLRVGRYLKRLGDISDDFAFI